MERITEEAHVVQYHPCSASRSLQKEAHHHASRRSADVTVQVLLASMSKLLIVISHPTDRIAFENVIQIEKIRGTYHERIEE